MTRTRHLANLRFVELTAQPVDGDLPPRRHPVFLPLADGPTREMGRIHLTGNGGGDSGCDRSSLKPTPDGYIPLPPICRTLEFRKSGEYRWTAVSDYVERDEVGRWNFRLTDETSGLVYLDNGSLVRFAKEGRDLWFLSGRARDFMPASEMDYGPAEFDLGRDTLPNIEPSAMYRRLTDNPWSSASEFNSLDSITYRDDGTYLISYRDGSCTHEGSWSLDHGSRGPHGPSLTSAHDGNDCGLTSSGPSISVARARLEGNRLVSQGGDALYDAAELPAGKVFSFNSYSGFGVEVTGEYVGTFERDVPLEIRFTFRNANERGKTLDLGNFEITAQRLAREKDHFSRIGEELSLAKRDYAGMSLRRGESHTDNVVITPLISGDVVQLTIRLDFTDIERPNRPTYTGRQHYVVNFIGD